MVRRRARRRSKKIPVSPGSVPALWARSKLKFVVFSLIPVFLLVGGAETVLRLFELAVPSLGTLPLPAEYAGLFQPDEELFWSLRRDLEVTYRGTTIKTNALALRGPPIGPKSRNEFRILSLGESSTFGVGVADSETYSSQLETYLNRARGDSGHGKRRFRVINAGVPAYSSFQSLQYLKRRGLALEPNLVLFYHEVNDYLPSTFRDSSNTEIGISRSDRELYYSRSGSIARKLLAHSALHRFISFRLATHRIQGLQRQHGSNPLVEIGLPDVSLPARITRWNEHDAAAPVVDSRALPRRVTEDERRLILEELVAVCRRHNILLVIIHPAYRDSTRHTCLLTRFCQGASVDVFDAYDALHPAGLSSSTMFLDAWHPTSKGHHRLARTLGAFLLEGVLSSGS